MGNPLETRYRTAGAPVSRQSEATVHPFLGTTVNRGCISLATLITTVKTSSCLSSRLLVVLAKGTELKTDII